MYVHCYVSWPTARHSISRSCIDVKLYATVLVAVGVIVTSVLLYDIHFYTVTEAS